MSVWTHVAAIVRVDALRIPGFRDPNVANHFSRVPMGSEGGLTVEVVTNPDTSHMSAYTVAIFGDLRDYHESQSIIDWLNERCNALPDRGGFVRQASAEVWTEGQEPVLWRYKDPKDS